MMILINLVYVMILFSAAYHKILFFFFYFFLCIIIFLEIRFFVFDVTLFNYFKPLLLFNNSFINITSSSNGGVFIFLFVLNI
jgi:hypothetical protein